MASSPTPEALALSAEGRPGQRHDYFINDYLCGVATLLYNLPDELNGAKPTRYSAEALHQTGEHGLALLVIKMNSNWIKVREEHDMMDQLLEVLEHAPELAGFFALMTSYVHPIASPVTALPCFQSGNSVD